MISQLKRLNCRGQNITEYSLLIVLVLAGVIVMGPYVTRSWNANAKGWEDSVRDTYFDDAVTNETSEYLKQHVIDIYH